MRRQRILPIGALLLLSFLVVAPHAPAEGPQPAATEPVSPEALDQFEKKVRPILVDNCLRCHGAEKQSSGLRLDSRQAILAGGNSGPALVPGDPENSTLVLAIGHEDESLKMPPKAKLADAEIEALTAWVKVGAPWPSGDLAASGVDVEMAQAHWAFQPVRPVQAPPVKDTAWVASPIDAFILAALEARGMTPSPPADRRTLIRRATFDLTGLPPTEGEVAAFEADPAPDAFARVVDRLLASPRYGERWGRHWLDVARYADTKGYVFQEERRYPNSYTYRDYVVRAFNDDLPYDRFVTHQIAADLLPLGDGPRPLAALGFLTVGRRFLNNGDDIIDDRIDVVTRGLLGLTVACARCHDHKFDPIPAEDYYSLYGVFASSVEPKELPLLEGPGEGRATEDYEKAVLARRRAVEEYVEARLVEFQAELRSKIVPYLLAAYDLEYNPRHPKFDELTRSEKIRPELLRRLMERWKEHLARTRDGRDSWMAAWHAFAEIPAAEFSAKAAEVAGRLAEPGGSQTSGPAVAAVAFTESPPGSMREVVQRYGELMARAGSAEAPEASQPAGSTDEGLASLRRWLDSDESPLAIAAAEIPRLINRAERNRYRELEKKVAELDVTHPGAPPRAMVLNDKPQPYEPRVFVRGNPGRPGKAVPRRFLKVVSGPDRKPFASGSGRLELAREIVRPDNPLTARVLVNRLWMHHFGAGLVRTASDFGLRSDPPSHPDLLDDLARRFVEGGWSIKAMHRLIMLSNSYRQRSDARPECLGRDPQNLLLWRQNRRRLDFESMRDALLATAGRLDTAMGGRPVSITDAPFSARRTVYGFIDRQNLDGVFRTFDFASPDATSPNRHVTTVPQQALFLMNSPFVAEQARHVAARAEGASCGEGEPRIRQLYRLLFGRDATPSEVAAGLRFLDRRAGGEESKPPGGWQYGHGELDEETGRVRDFRPFPHWTGKAWQLGDKLPDPEGSFLHLNASGGHAGRDARQAAIRRWVAPRDALIAIEGTLEHASREGDGVRGRIVAGRSGTLGDWTAHEGKVPAKIDRLEVAQGETVDFVVDCRSGHDHDTFSWAPVVRLLEPDSSGASPRRWDARADFRGPEPDPLAPWEAYAQVLLLTNEFMYID